MSKSSISRTKVNAEMPEDYNALLLWAQNAGNRFAFRRDYVNSRLMTKVQALFFQDLINLCCLDGRQTRWHTEKGEKRLYYLFTESYLIQSLSWEPTTQTRFLALLGNKNYLHTIQAPTTNATKCRWVWLNIVGVEKLIQMWLSGGEVEDICAVCHTNVVHQSHTNVVHQCHTNVGDQCHTNVVLKNGDTNVSPTEDNKDSRKQCRSATRPSASPAGDGVSGCAARDGELPVGQPKERPLRDEWATDCAERLYKALARKRLTTSRSAPSSWSKEFTTLATGIDHPEGLTGAHEEIKTILHWYIDHLGAEFCPEAYCGKTFRTKYAQIVAFRNRHLANGGRTRRLTEKEQEDINIW